MFDFEKLDLYGVVKSQNVAVFNLLSNANIDETIAIKWKNSSLNSLFNLVQSSGRVAHNEKRDFLTTARGYIFECTSLLQVCLELNQISEEEYIPLYEEYERISKMMLGMLRSFSL